MLHKLKRETRRMLKRARGHGFRLLSRSKESYECPVCAYTGPFLDADDPTGLRKNAMCPSCSALERHRALWLALTSLPERARFGEMSLLHFAPEPELEDRLRPLFGRYETADLLAPGVDHQVDLRKLPFADASYDFVIAAHVLEHIVEDQLAIAEVRRVLRPGGIAILQVPTIGSTTVEYAAPNEAEWGHVRSPGEDYFERYAKVFSRVATYRSSQFEPRFQPWVIENRSAWPAPFALRPSVPGERHEEVVPVCYA